MSLYCNFFFFDGTESLRFHTYISSFLYYLTEKSLNPFVLNIWTDHRPQNLPELFKLHSTLVISSSVLSTPSTQPVVVRLLPSFWSGERISQQLQVLGAQFLCRADSTGGMAAEEQVQR